MHRPTTDEEQRNMFGDEIVDNEKIVANNAFDPEQFVKVGDLPSGAEFFCNKLAVECDLLVTEGFICRILRRKKEHTSRYMQFNNSKRKSLLYCYCKSLFKNRRS